MERDAFIEDQKLNYDSYKLPKISLIHYCYDFLVFLFHNFPHKAANKEIYSLYKEFSLYHKTILDIGSYTGYKTFYLHAHRNIVTGIDQSKTMIDYAKKRFRFYNIPFLLGEINEILEHLENGSFDFIYCNVMPLHYDTQNLETSEYFRETLLHSLKKLKPGGIFYYSFYTIKNTKCFAPITMEAIIHFLHNNDIKHYSLRIKPKNKFNNPVIECLVFRKDDDLYKS